MYLKSIEVQGFKSFYGKMVFAFDKGITAIVGPNGSGKSNVADAVRWVLGEQKAKLLRSSKMSDVIFAGTQARKALSFCEVALTIVNDDNKLPIDYDEVTVTRRVYRSGESEYYINGAGCRMKDIYELFMDTGVGREGYSIIGQGQIDKILSNKPEQRRGLFDEAAGIVKYKKRKENALKKLEEEKQNLYRINDIVTELAAREQSLEKKASKARKFIDLKQQLKIREIKSFVDNVKQLDKDISVNSELHSNIKREIVDITKKLDKNDYEHKAKNELAEQNLCKLEELSKSMIELQNKKSEEDKNRSLIKQRLEHLDELIKKSDTEKASYESKMASLLEELSKYKKEVDDVFVKSEQVYTIIEQKESSLNELRALIAKNQKELTHNQNTIIDSLNNLSSLKSERQHFYSTTKSEDDRKRSIINRKLILSKTLKSQNEQYKELGLTKRAFKKDIKKLEAEIEGVLSSKSEIKNKLEQANHNLQNTNSVIANKESKYSALYDLIYSYEGFNYSIKKVMELKSKYNEHIFGVVTDVIKVSDDYERAIEISLGSTYQNIIVSTADIAKVIIEYLKKNRFGRATFLPLDTIVFYDNRKDLSGVKGFVGYADELVSFDSKYDNAIKFLLGKTVIAKTLDDALFMRKHKNVNYKIVTLSGEVLNAGGAMTGGAYKNKGNQFLARKREYEKLGVDISSLKQKSATYNNDIINLKLQLSDVNDSINSLNEKLKTARDKQNELSINMHKIDSDLLRNKDELEDINFQLQNISSGITDNDEAIKAISEKINSLDKFISNTEKAIEDGKNDVANNLKARDELVEEINKIKLESTRLFEQKSSSENIISRMNVNISEIKDSLEMLSVDREVYVKEAEEKKKWLDNSSNDCSSIETDIEKLKLSREVFQKKKDELRIKLEEIYNAREVLQKNLSNLEKEEVRISNRLEKLSAKRNESYDYMWSTYELTYSECEKSYDSIDISFDNLKSDIKSLKSQMKSLGDVDVNSIDEYVEVSERYKFLSEQKEDIEKSEQKLSGMIVELDKLMVEQFNDSFKHINKEFQDVFKSLFGGGKAYIELTDTTNVLESGIEIHVQPPGKKLQSMMLLSGGERAFTAIALLFAILNLKPTPFCVLDEIEAALDDTNVEKFAKYLKKISKKMQFIVITHRRGTMENSDSLYGITMKEKGISKQVSVKLIDNEIK